MIFFTLHRTEISWKKDINCLWRRFIIFIQLAWLMWGRGWESIQILHVMRVLKFMFSDLIMELEQLMMAFSFNSAFKFSFDSHKFVLPTVFTINCALYWYPLSQTQVCGRYNSFRCFIGYRPLSSSTYESDSSKIKRKPLSHFLSTVDK